MVISKRENVAYDNNYTQELAPPPSSSSSLIPLQQETPISAPNTQTSNSSVLSLTLDDIQCKSGRAFGSMNMDEFLTNIWNSDEIPVDDDSQPPRPPPPPPSQNDDAVSSQFSVRPPICKKTVDEVWSEIHRENHHTARENNEEGNNNNNNNNGSLKRQQTLGEMTLEDFLIKAGVVQKSSLSVPPKSSSSPHQNQDQTGNIGNNRGFGGNYNNNNMVGRVGYGNTTTTTAAVVCTAGNVNNGRGVIARTYHHQVFPTQSHLIINMNKDVTVAAISSSSNCGGVLNVEKLRQCMVGESSGGSNKRMIIDGPPEVVVERRQRRMLKNRESAARSRARRQAYTVELEAGLSQLRQENEELKQILAEAERKRRQEVAQRKHSTKAQQRTEKFRAIRRTMSATW